MAYSDEKTGGCSCSSRPLTYFIYDLPHDCSDRSGEEGGQRATEVQDSISTTIYISGPTFVKLAHDLNLSCFSPTFVTKKVFPMEQNT